MMGKNELPKRGDSLRKILLAEKYRSIFPRRSRDDKGLLYLGVWAFRSSFIEKIHNHVTRSFLRKERGFVVSIS